MMRRWLRWRVALGAVLVVGLAGLAVRGVIEERSQAAREAAAPKPGAAPAVSQQNGEPVITLDAAAQRDDGIVTLALKNAPHRQEVRAYGVVLDLQPLTDLDNRYQNAKAGLAIAQAKLAATRAEFERDRKLYKNGRNISAAELQKAEAAFRVDQAGLAAAQSELRTIAVTAQQSWGAPLGAAITDDAPLLARLIARQDVLLQATLRPGQTIAEPPAGAAVELTDGARHKLLFVSAATRTDPRVQGRSFFFTAPADSGLLPGMAVVVFLASGPAAEAAVVPQSAVVWEGGRAWAYFRTGPGRFARRPIATDRRAPDGGYLVRGIPNDAVVVVAGAQMLLSEEFRGQTRAGGQGDED